MTAKATIEDQWNGIERKDLAPGKDKLLPIHDREDDAGRDGRDCQRVERHTEQEAAQFLIHARQQTVGIECVDLDGKQAVDETMLASGQLLDAGPGEGIVEQHQVLQLGDEILDLAPLPPGPDTAWRLRLRFLPGHGVRQVRAAPWPAPR